jgi:hypothetical protein
MLFQDELEIEPRRRALVNRHALGDRFEASQSDDDFVVSNRQAGEPVNANIVGND